MVTELVLNLFSLYDSKMMLSFCSRTEKTNYEPILANIVAQATATVVHKNQQYSLNSYTLVIVENYFTCYAW